MSVSKRLIINVALFLAVASGSILTGCRSEKEPVDYVNPYIGISVICWYRPIRQYICPTVCFVFIRGVKILREIS